MSQQLVPNSFFWLGDMETNFHIFQGSSILKSSIFGGQNEMTYIWQSQAPVSINMCLTMKCLLKEYKAEEVPYSFLFSNGYRKQRKFMWIEAEKRHSCLPSMSRFIPVFESFLKVQIKNDIFKFLLLLVNVGCYNRLAMVNIIN